MADYAYLVASVPTPRFGERAPMSPDEFVALCARVAPEGDAPLVARARLAPPAGFNPALEPCDLLRDFWTRETSLRNELVRLRAQKLGRGQAGHDPSRGTALGGCTGFSEDPEAVNVARRAFAEPDPLASERALASETWAWIERVASLARDDVRFLIAYMLKLQICERLSLFAADAGRKRFDSIYATVLEGARSASGA